MWSIEVSLLPHRHVSSCISLSFFFCCCLNQRIPCTRETYFTEKFKILDGFGFMFIQSHHLYICIWEKLETVMSQAHPLLKTSAIHYSEQQTTVGINAITHSALKSMANCVKINTTKSAQNSSLHFSYSAFFSMGGLTGIPSQKT